MEQMTLKEAIAITLQILENISVPIAYRKTIAEPIGIAADNLSACLDGIAKAEEENHGETDPE